MQVRDIMTPEPVWAEKGTPLEEVARMMVEGDCGGIPICEAQTRHVVGFVTDRDIVCRILAKGLDPLEMMAQDAMTTEVHTIRPDASVDECIRMMQRFKVRRLPVTNEQGQLVGIVSQADLVRRAIPAQPEMLEELEEALEEICAPKAAV